MVGPGRLPAILAVCLLGLVAFPACDFGSDDRPTQEPQRVETEPSKEIGPDTVVQIDAASGRVRAVIPVGPDVGLMETASGQVWIVSGGDRTLSRIDPVSERATTVDVGEPAGLTSAGSDVWVAVGGNRILKLNGATGAAKTSLRLGARPLFALGDAGFPVFGRGSLWLTIPKLGEPAAPQAVWRIDPRTGNVLAKLPIGVNPLPPLAAGRYVWIITRPERGPGELSRIDMASGRSSPVAAGTLPWGLAAGARSVWVGHINPPEVWRLNPASGKPTAKIAVDEEVRGLSFGGGSAWVTTATSLLQIDPTTDEVARTIRLTEPGEVGGPFVVAYLDGSAWVSVD